MAKDGIQLKIKEGFFTARNVGYMLIAFSVVSGLFLFMLWISSAPRIAGTSLPALSKGNQNLLSLIMVFSFGPYSIFAAYHHNKIAKIENKFAEFLMDLAEYWKSGLSMTVAIKTLAKGDYGALTEEVRKMEAQISWGISFNEVLHQLGERIQTRLVIRSVSLIEEANTAGGRISDILESAAKDAKEIKWLENERKEGVKMYIVVIYIAFGVYLAVIGIIVALFLPAIVGTSAQQEAQEAGSSGDDGGMGGGMAGMGTTKISKTKLSFIFYSSVLVQSIGEGLMAGMMGEGKLSAGFRHVVIMVLMGWGTFILLDKKVGLSFSGG